MEAYESFSRADGRFSLAPDDLELLATCAYMIGREAEYRELLERAHRAHLDAGEELAALRCAFWIGVTLASHGEIGRASGWLRRARRLLERRGGDRVERGHYCYRTCSSKRRAATGRRLPRSPARPPRSGSASATPNLFALAAHEQGETLIELRRLDESPELLDEAMVAVTAGELSPDEP